MCILRVEDKIAGRGVIPRNTSAIGMLVSSAAAMPDHIGPFADIIEDPIDEAAAIQTIRPIGSSSWATVCPNLLDGTPTGIPTDHKRFSTPKVVDLSDERTCRLYDFSPFFCQIIRQVLQQLIGISAYELQITYKFQKSIAVFEQFIQHLLLLLRKMILRLHFFRRFRCDRDV